MARDVIRLFLTQLPGQISELKNHIEQSDAVAAGGLAHMLKGAASNVSAQHIRKTAQSIELTLKDGKGKDITDLIGQLENQAIEFREALQKVEWIKDSL